jgi:hypothetical protein
MNTNMTIHTEMMPRILLLTSTITIMTMVPGITMASITITPIPTRIHILTLTTKTITTIRSAPPARPGE